MGDLSTDICRDCGRDHPSLEYCDHYLHLPVDLSWTAPKDSSKQDRLAVMWDEATRGPRMSNVSGRTIFKYQMPVQEEFSMRLPAKAEIIRVADMDGMFWMWAVVDTNAALEQRNFKAFKTGAPMPDGHDLKYIGFCRIYVQMELGLYIFEDRGPLRQIKWLTGAAR